MIDILEVKVHHYKVRKRIDLMNIESIHKKLKLKLKDWFFYLFEHALTFSYI